MYMEAYGNVGSVADSIIKKSIEAGFGRKMAKEDLKEAAKETKQKNQDVQWNESAISNDGVSPSGGVGSKADPDTKKELDAVSQMKAQESLRSQLEAIQGRNIYLQELANNRQKQIEAMHKDIGEINNALKGMIK